MKKLKKNIIISLTLFLSFSFFISSLSEVNVLSAPSSGSFSSKSKSSTSTSSKKSSKSSTINSNKSSSNNKVSSGSFSSNNKNNTKNNTTINSTTNKKNSSSSKSSLSSNNTTLQTEQGLVFMLTSIVREFRYLFGRNIAVRILFLGLGIILIFAIIRRLKK